MKMRNRKMTIFNSYYKSSCTVSLEVPPVMRSRVYVASECLEF